MGLNAGGRHIPMRTSPSSPPDQAVAWHALGVAQVLQALEGNAEQGLDEVDALRRAARWGANAMPPARRDGPWRRLFAQFHNVLIYVLLAAAAVTFALGDHADAAVIAAVVLINALVGFVHEGKAQQALDAIADLLPLNAMVKRGGVPRTVPAHQLVPGDIVHVASGDRIPADLRLIAARSLRIDESALTGESVPADKQVNPVAPDAVLGERACMAYSGSLVRHGSGTGVVVAIAGATELGRVSRLLARVVALDTPLARKMAAFARVLSIVVVLIAAALVAFGTVVRGYSLAEMFGAAVGLAVAAIPEGLPAIVTITLAIGVRRMARRHAIVRRLPAVEALGAATVICTDKTGTLTCNEMAVRRLITADGVLAVQAKGYAPSGALSLDGVALSAAECTALDALWLACALCNDAHLQCREGHWELSGDPTEGALLSLAMKAGLDVAAARAAHPRLDVLPFESEHGYMASLHAAQVVLKGAPERLLPLCTRQRGGALDTAFWERRMAEAAEAGMRLIALAARGHATAPGSIDGAAVEAGGFTLLGVAAMEDPPRPEAIAAVARCRAAGIAVKMVTGDHAATARAIAGQLGFPQPVRTLSGAELDAIDDAALAAVLAGTDVFARAAPEHKLRLVRALQQGGAVVVMTGDGVNDAPALKAADIGVAMGHKGTEAAKDAAEIVLADDNFATLAAAVEHGRVVYDNIRKSIVFALSTNGGEAGVLMVAILLGMTLPIAPVQILWVNMITEVTLSLALAFEQAESDVMARPPRAPGAPIISGVLMLRIGMVSALLVAGCMGLFLWELRDGASLAQGRTVVINTLVTAHVTYLFNCRRLSHSALSWEGVSGNRVALAAIAVSLALQGLLTYWAPLQRWFGTADIGVQSWLRIAAFGVLLFLIVEGEKALRRRAAGPPGAADRSGRQAASQDQ